MAETPLRWARIDEDLMTAARGRVVEVLAPDGPAADDSTVIRAGLHLITMIGGAELAMLRDAIERGRKVAGWPKRAAS